MTYNLYNLTENQLEIFLRKKMKERNFINVHIWFSGAIPEVKYSAKAICLLIEVFALGHFLLNHKVSLLFSINLIDLC